MKAKIIPEPKRVLLWNCPQGSEDYGKVEALCQEYGLDLRPLSGADAGKTVGFLCGFRGARDTAALLYLDEATYPPAIILCGLARNQVNGFVDKLNASGAHLPLKALVTIHNRDWMLSQLLEELARERTAWEGKEL